MLRSNAHRCARSADGQEALVRALKSLANKIQYGDESLWNNPDSVSELYRDAEVVTTVLRLRVDHLFSPPTA